MKKIVIVEDDPILGRALVLTLESAGYGVDWHNTIADFQGRPEKVRIDLLILDVGLPDGDGIALLKELRERGFRSPVVLLTAKDHVDSIVDGLGAGANDYIKKPFDNKELLARIRNVLREITFTERKLQIGELTITLEKRLAMLGEEELELNRRQFDILVFLGERQGNVVTRENLIFAIKSDGEMLDRTVDSHISHLRSALKKAGVKNITIASVYGVGYRLEVTERKADASE